MALGTAQPAVVHPTRVRHLVVVYAVALAVITDIDLKKLIDRLAAFPIDLLGKDDPAHRSFCSSARMASVGSGR
jgi:hypothetical protein